MPTKQVTITHGDHTITATVYGRYDGGDIVDMSIVWPIVVDDVPMMPATLAQDQINPIWDALYHAAFSADWNTADADYVPDGGKDE